MRLSCYLLRESASPSDVVRSTPADVRYYRGTDEGWTTATSLDVAQEQSDRLAAIYRTTAQQPSDWQMMIADWESGVDPDADDFVLEARQDRGAIFFFRVGGDRWVSWSFGRGWHYLQQAKLDPRFGVISALNDLTSVEDEAVFRRLLVRREAGIPQVVGRSTFGDAPIGAFDLDEIWDAIKSVGGRNSSGNMIQGSLSFVEAQAVEAPDDLEELSAENLDRYQGTGYRDRFGFLDNYVPISDDARESTLDSTLAGRLKDDPSVAAFVYPPPISSLSDEDIGIVVCFPYERKQDGRLAVGSQAIAQNPRLRDEDDAIDFDATIRFYGSDDRDIRASLRECLAAQFDFDESTYVLADGVYYEVNRDFVAGLDDFLRQRIVDLEGAPTYQGHGENAWLGSASGTGEFHKIHPETFTPEGITGKVEIADLVSANGSLLHVKVGADALAAANVTRQAISAAEALIMYPTTAEWLMERQVDPPFAGLETVLHELPRPRIGVTFLGRDGDNLARISLFAKLALERAVRHLEERDFHVRLHFVPKELGD